MQRMYLGYMCFCFALAPVLVCVGLLPGLRDVALFSIFALIAAAWCFVRSRGRSYGWLIIGALVFIVLPLMKNLWPSSSESVVPTNPIGRAAFAAGDKVLRLKDWVYDKIRYHPRDTTGSPSD